MRGRAVLFGLNYAHCKQGQLNGCVNDVKQVAKLIYSMFDEQMPVELYTDDVDRKNTSYDGILQKLYDVAIASYRDNLDYVWVHYSGHGSHQKDISGDESDGQDEGLVPSDYETKGLLLDDVIHRVMSCFNPKTKILFVSDCCHSGSILDLTYVWNEQKQSFVENKKCTIRSPTILISGCRDSQTSADAYNLLKDNQHIGALTASIIKVLQSNRKYIFDAFAFVDAVRKELKKGRFEQYPCLSSTFDLTTEPSLIPKMQKREIDVETKQDIPAPSLYPKPPQYPIQCPQQLASCNNNAQFRPAYVEAPTTYASSYTPVQPQYIYTNQVVVQQPIIVTYIPLHPYIDVSGYGYCV
jgi:hypothetical protein